MNKTLSYTAIILSLLVIFLLLESCKNATNSETDTISNFANSIETIKGANNVTMDLDKDRSQGSKFIVTYSNIGSNSSIANGQKRAWCVEWDIPAIYDVQSNVKLYKTEGSDYWKEINYLLSKEEELKIQNPNLGWKELQIVIWSLVKYKDFKIEQIPEYEGLGSYYKDGEYLFDSKLAKSIVEEVESMATANDYPKYAIIAENEGQTIITRSD